VSAHTTHERRGRAHQALPQDSSTQTADAVPTFNGFSANGNVTAELVYVNYGREEDYALLAQQVTVSR
jgi:N-acetylated-alpha-linked acidic dipeptidase